MGKRLDVHYGVLNTLTRRYGPNQTSDLLGVNYVVAVPPDTEFPRLISSMDLFVRFFLAGVGPTEIAVFIIRLDEDGNDFERVARYRRVLPFDPADEVRDFAFRLVRINLTGTGVYAVRVCRKAKHRWRGQRWKRLWTDYFRVVR